MTMPGDGWRLGVRTCPASVIIGETGTSANGTRSLRSRNIGFGSKVVKLGPQPRVGIQRPFLSGWRRVELAAARSHAQKSGGMVVHVHEAAMKFITLRNDSTFLPMD